MDRNSVVGKNNRNLYLVLGTTVLLLVGVVYAWSIFSVPLADAYGWNSQELGVNYTIMMSFFCLSAIVSSVFNSRTASPRISLFLAALLFLTGFAATAYFTYGKIQLLYLFYGALVGSGAGFAYNAILSTVSAWFPEKRGFVSGVLLMGFGASTLVLGSLASSVIESQVVSWKIVFSVIGLSGCVGAGIAGCILHYPWAGENASSAGAAASDQKEEGVTTGRMLGSFSFWAFFAFAVLGSAIGAGVISSARQIAVETGAGLSISALYVGMLSVANGFGRILFGGLYDRRGRHISMCWSIVLYGAAILLLLTALKLSVSYLAAAGFLLMGLGYGSVPTMSAAFVAAQYGEKYYASNFSVMNLSLMVASTASLLSGTLYMRYSSYIPFLLAAVLMWCGLLASCLLLNRRLKAEHGCF